MMKPYSQDQTERWTRWAIDEDLGPEEAQTLAEALALETEQAIGPQHPLAERPGQPTAGENRASSHGAVSPLNEHMRRVRQTAGTLREALRWESERLLGSAPALRPVDQMAIAARLYHEQRGQATPKTRSIPDLMTHWGPVAVAAIVLLTFTLTMTSVAHEYVRGENTKRVHAQMMSSAQAEAEPSGAGESGKR